MIVLSADRGTHFLLAVGAIVAALSSPSPRQPIVAYTSAHSPHAPRFRFERAGIKILVGLFRARFEGGRKSSCFSEHVLLPACFAGGGGHQGRGRQPGRYVHPVCVCVCGDVHNAGKRSLFAHSPHCFLSSAPAPTQWHDRSTYRHSKGTHSMPSNLAWAHL